MSRQPLGAWLQGTSLTLPGRFWSKVRSGGPDECWLWQAPLDPKGYGRIRLTIPGGRATGLAHRVAYELVVGPIPEGLTLDHLCRNRSCVNPRHLEAVTSAENTRRGFSPPMVTKRTNVCKRGHSMENALFLKGGAVRTCRKCANDSKRARRSAARNVA